MKRNPMLARIEAAAEARYQARFHSSMDMLLQMGQDAAMIAAHDVLQLGPGRAEDFCVAYREAINKIYLTNQCLTVMIKKEMYNLMQNEVEKMKIGVGAMSELLRMFYDSLIKQNFTPEQAIQLTSDYIKAVFGK